MSDLEELNDTWYYLKDIHENIRSQIKDLEREDEFVIQDIKDLMKEAEEKGFKLNNYTLTWEEI